VDDSDDSDGTKPPHEPLNNGATMNSQALNQVAKSNTLTESELWRWAEIKVIPESDFNTMLGEIRAQQQSGSNIHP
jgi:hypothetical protein